MSNLPQQDTIKQYYGDGATTDFIVPFYVPLEADGTPDIDVYVTLDGATPDPAADLQVYPTAYTYAANSDPITGGTITFNPGYIPADQSTVTLSRDVSASLDVEFADARNFNGQALDDALDKLLLLIQQNKTYALERNLSYKVNALQADTDITANTQLDQLQDGYIWMGQSGGVVAVELTSNDNWSTLRSQLADENPTTNGASLVGYYDTVNSNPTTVKDFLDNLVPFIQTEFDLQFIKPGMMFDYAGTSAPTGYLDCDGSAVSRTTYADLFTAIGTTWGVGDGSTTFNLPDFRRAVAAGSGGSGTATLGNAVGDSGGSETHTLTSTELPNPITTTAANASASSGSSFGAIKSDGTPGSGTIANSGGGQAHNIIQPTNIVLKIIKT